ncbi:MAG: protein kinase [Planctomycetia bacterium]|nr:protein kinase [Planctomycetia bacterium]
MPVRLVSQEELPGPLKGYRLIERLGRGGFGEVWKIEAPGGMHKAAKFVFGDLEAMDEESRPAEQELKALERVKGIRHPYILSLEQFRVIEGQLIIVMELADRNLWDRFRECRGQGLAGIPREELMRYMEETAEALDLMNNYYQIQHLDVKPQNLFLVFNHIKVADFGLAKVLEGVKATVTGGVTPVYAAPETFEGWVSRYSDQYSLAIVFQELLTGTRPFNGTNTRQLLMQHLNGTPDLAALPLADRSIINRALAKKPDDRWPSCTELIRALKLPSYQAGTPTPLNHLTPRLGSAPPASPVQSPADSVQATRMAVQPDTPESVPSPIARVQSFTPSGLPPLVKPTPGSGGIPMPAQTPPGSNPRLVTPGNVPNNPALTLNRPLILQTGRMGNLGIAPPEKTGAGALFPALIIGLGHTGRRVLEQLKRIIADRYGRAEKVPNVRLLCVDTDAETATGSAEGTGTLAPREFVSARLNRPSHYMQRDSLPPVEQWLPSGALFKLPRNPGPANGVRSFGRLALFDHYRTVAQRVRQEIETFLTDDPLLEADKKTHLGLRTNRPRAYIIAGLAGGTGSGMFLDIAFLVRHELRQVGYMRPETVGVFFVPPVDSTRSRSVAVGNTFAALTELHHFQARKSRYQTVFDKSEAPITDGDAPFTRTALLQLPKGTPPSESQGIVVAAARALFNEMLTPAGKVIDEVRDDYRTAHPSPVPTCQTFHLFRLSWPRAEVLAAATRRFAQRQIQRWTGKESDHLREHIAGWLNRQWSERRLSFEAIVDTFNDTVRAALREDPDRVFDAFIDPLHHSVSGPGKFDATSVCIVLDQLLKVVGKPEIETDSQPSSLYAALSSKYEELTKETEGHVAVMAATFLEVPQYRLPGAEEAVRQISEKLKRQVDALEPIHADLTKEVRTTYARLFHTIGTLNTSALGGITRKFSNEIIELMRAYPRKRLQLHMLDMALSLLRKLLGNTPEYLREINFCRTTLGDIHSVLARDAAAATETGPGMLILPDGCRDLDAAADQFLAGLAPEELLAFDHSFQKDLTRKFRGLGAVCLKPIEKGPAFRELLLRKAREFLDTKLDHSDPATVFFRSRTQAGTAQSLVAEGFDKATPDLTTIAGAKPYEFTVLGAPITEAGEQLMKLARSVLPGIETTAAPLPEDICFYREYPQLPLVDLPQLGSPAFEAYQNMGSENPPHTRTDITWQPPTS